MWPWSSVCRGGGGLVTRRSRRGPREGCELAGLAHNEPPTQEAEPSLLGHPPHPHLAPSRALQGRGATPGAPRPPRQRENNQIGSLPYCKPELKTVFPLESNPNTQLWTIGSCMTQLLSTPGSPIAAARALNAHPSGPLHLPCPCL